MVYTKERRSEYMRLYRKDRWDYIYSVVGDSCVKCGSKNNLEVDHIDYTTKSFTIGSNITIALELLNEELKKCQVLCHSCHVIKTNAEGSAPGHGGSNKISDYDHGTGHMYYKDKCRCQKCSSWRRDYRNRTVDYQGRPRN